MYEAPTVPEAVPYADYQERKSESDCIDVNLQNLPRMHGMQSLDCCEPCQRVHVPSGHAV